MTSRQLEKGTSVSSNVTESFDVWATKQTQFMQHIWKSLAKKFIVKFANCTQYMMHKKFPAWKHILGEKKKHPKYAKIHVIGNIYWVLVKSKEKKKGVENTQYMQHMKNKMSEITPNICLIYPIHPSHILGIGAPVWYKLTIWCHISNILHSAMDDD